MTRLPTLTPHEVVAALKRASFVEDRQQKSHLHLWHPERRRVTTVPMHSRDLPRPVVKEISLGRQGEGDLTAGNRTRPGAERRCNLRKKIEPRNENSGIKPGKTPHRNPHWSRS